MKKPLLAPSDTKVYKRTVKPITRSPGQVTLTFNLPVEMKESLGNRRNRTDRSVASLCQWAIAFQEKHGWKFIHKAMTEDEVLELQKLGDKYPLKPVLYPDL